MRALLTWAFETGGYTAGTVDVAVDGDEFVVGGSDRWKLVEKPSTPQPDDAWPDATTEQLVGAWTLVEIDAESGLARIAAQGDTCSFNPDHTIVCDGPSTLPAIWQTMREWPEESSYSGNKLTIVANGIGLSAEYSIAGNTLEWDIADAVWERAE
jgi:hypothetical protein